MKDGLSSGNAIFSSTLMKGGTVMFENFKKGFGLVMGGLAALVAYGPVISFVKPKEKKSDK